MKTQNKSHCCFFQRLWFKLFGKCPRPFCCFERKKCKRLRAELAAASPIKLPDGSIFVFTNQLSGFNASGCPGGMLPTVDQLAEISKALKIRGCWLCPMLVWATEHGTPVLARIRPGCCIPVKVVCTPSHCCKAFIICVVKEKCIRLKPCGSIALRDYQPPESITAITFKAFTDEGSISTVGLYDRCSTLQKAAHVDGTPKNVIWTCLTNPAFLKNDGCSTVCICRLTVE